MDTLEQAWEFESGMFGLIDLEDLGVYCLRCVLGPREWRDEKKARIGIRCCPPPPPPETVAVDVESTLRKEQPCPDPQRGMGTEATGAAAGWRRRVSRRVSGPGSPRRGRPYTSCHTPSWPAGGGGEPDELGTTILKSYNCQKSVFSRFYLSNIIPHIVIGRQFWVKTSSVKMHQIKNNGLKRHPTHVYLDFGCIWWTVDCVCSLIEKGTVANRRPKQNRNGRNNLTYRRGWGTIGWIGNSSFNGFGIFKSQ